MLVSLGRENLRDMEMGKGWAMNTHENDDENGTSECQTGQGRWRIILMGALLTLLIIVGLSNQHRPRHASAPVPTGYVPGQASNLPDDTTSTPVVSRPPVSVAPPVTNNPPVQAEPHVSLTKPGWFATLTYEDLRLVYQMVDKKDYSALARMQAEKRAVIMRGGVPVDVVDIGLTGWVTFRVRGETITLWTVREALEIR
jgi:hypothetical protein